MFHTPVLLKEVIELLDPRAGDYVLDATVGLGGHAEIFAEKVCPGGHLTGLDADEQNLEEAHKRLERFGECVELKHINFREISSLGLSGFDIIFADLGLSSPHVDDSSRGFTFRENAPLDMRYDRSKGVKAGDLIRFSKEKDLADIFWKYGELKNSRRLARVIKKSGRIETTFQLKECVEKVSGYRAKYVLPQVFQAIRIALNDEIKSLCILLGEGQKLLKRGGRMGIISYHSLEDRLVKRLFKKLAEPLIDPVSGQVVNEASFTVITKKPVVPSEEEVRSNPRSRSAKLRVIGRLPT